MDLGKILGILFVVAIFGPFISPAIVVIIAAITGGDKSEAFGAAGCFGVLGSIVGAFIGAVIGAFIGAVIGNNLGFAAGSDDVRSYILMGALFGLPIGSIVFHIIGIIKYY
jgi:MFS family permease